MVDLKRLIESMELCKSAERDCHKCMYCETENDCRDSMIYDAVELLKEKKPIKPIRHENWWECPSCGRNIIVNMKYCYGCGKKVKWDRRAEGR